MIRTLAALLFCLAAPAQTNVDLSQGESGRVPPGWRMPQLVVDAGYSAELRRGGLPGLTRACVLFQSLLKSRQSAPRSFSRRFPQLPISERRSASADGLRGKVRGMEISKSVCAWSIPEISLNSSIAPKARSIRPQPRRRSVTARVRTWALRISIWARFHPAGPAGFCDPEFETAP